jgi:ASC-1-like (ASCH) protein
MSTKIWNVTIQNPNETPWLNWIESGIKTYEGRLRKGVWTQMKIGDTIIFECNKKVETVITDLKYFDDFKKAHDTLKNNLVPIENCTTDQVEKLYLQYFSKDDIKKYGVIAIGVKPTKLI